MALLDAYASAAEYRDRTGKSSTGEDATVLTICTAVSRFLERQLGNHRGERNFNQSTAATARTFDAAGGTRLWVDDLVSIDNDGIAVDEGNDGTYSTLFDPTAETWVALGPDNAAEFSEAYTRVDLLPRTDNTVLSRWPLGRRKVQITGTWGWPAVPGAIKEATIVIARQLTDLEKSGFTLQLENIDSSVQMAPGAASLIKQLKAQYSRRLPVFA